MRFVNKNYSHQCVYFGSDAPCYQIFSVNESSLVVVNDVFSSWFQCHLSSLLCPEENIHRSSSRSTRNTGLLDLEVDCPEAPAPLL